MTKSQQPVILIVDDEADNLDLLERTLRRDYSVHRATCGEDALTLLPQLPNLAVIITDQRMPGLTGTAMLREARVHRPEAVRIILTGYTEPTDLIDAINMSNVFRYITKPFHPDELKALLRRAMRVFHAGGGNMVDEVTGLANRGLLYRQLRRELAREDREPSGLLVIASIRLSPFDAMLASIGSMATEMVVAAAAERIEGAIRAMDVLAHLELGLFVLLLPSCKNPDAICSRLKAELNNLAEIEQAREKISNLHVTTAFVQISGQDTVAGVLEKLGVS